MKIKKLKIKLNKDNEYSDYRYFIPKSNNIKMTDGRDVDEAVQSLKDKIANLKEQANYLINKAPLVKYAEGTSIIATGCAEAPLRKFSIEGDSKQETREGYNKLPPMVEKTTTFQGRTYTSNGKGALSMTGVATGSGEVTFNLEKPILLGEENLYVHLSNNYATAGLGIRFLNENTRLFEILPTSVNMIENIGTTYAEQTITAIQIFQNDSNSFDMTIQPMICTSNSSLEFEQYGASPSIEYEAPIESVGDNINLLNFSNYIKNNLPNIEVTQNNDMSIVLNGTTNAYGGDIRCVYEKPITLKAGSYTFGYGVNGVNMFNNELNISSLGNGTYLVVKKMAGSFTETTITFDEDFELYNYNIHLKPNTTFEDFVIYPKICKGTSTGAYSPYGQGSIEIKQSAKNLANYTNNTTEKNFKIGDVKIGKTYSIYLNINGFISFNLRYGSSSGTLISTKYSVSGKRVYAFTATKNGVLYFNGFTSDAGAFVSVDEIMLIEGEYTIDTIPTYEKYQGKTKALYTQQPFRAIGDVKDRFVKKDDVWYEEHKIFRKIFDGTENWLLGAPNYRYYIEINNKAEMSNIDITPLSSRFVCVSGTGIEIDYDTIWLQKLSDSSFRINIFNTNYLSDLANFKKWLTELYNAGTPVYVDYVLETPTLISCTAEQVEVLESLQSYDKITYYSVDKTNNVQANIKLIYKQDINAILEGEGV